MSESNLPIEDEKFMKNVREARGNGFDLVCAGCGNSIDLDDDEPFHEMFCPHNPELEENRKIARTWAAKQEEQQGE